MSALSVSSMSSTAGSSVRMAVKSGRASRNSSLKMSARVSSQLSSFDAVMRSSCFAWFHSYSARASSTPS